MMSGAHDVTVLEDQKEHYAVLEMRMRECKGILILPQIQMQNIHPVSHYIHLLFYLRYEVKLQKYNPPLTSY